MSNILQFIIQLKDQMSSGVLNIASNANRAFDSMNRHAAQVPRSIADINNRLKTLRRTREISIDTRQIRRANREIQQLERQASRISNMGIRGGGAGGGIGGMSVMGLAKGFMGLQAVRMGAEAVTASIGSAMERGATRTSFGVLTGSDKKGDKLTGDLAKFAADTILGPGVFKNAQTMLSFGVSAENIMPIMKRLGDISGGSQEKLDGLALAFANTASAGRLTGQDLLQYVNAGFNPLQEISRTTGRSMAELRKQMEDGGITVKMVADAMDSATAPGGRFNNMLNKVAETPFGKFQKLQGQVQELAVKFGSALMPAVSSLLDVASPVLDFIAEGLGKVQKFLEPIATVYMQFMKAGFKAWMPIFKTLYEVAVPFFDHIKSFVQKVLVTVTPIMVNIINAVSTILGPVIKIVGPILGKLLDVLGWIIQKIGWVIEKFTWLFSKLADGISWLMDKTIGTVKSKTAVLQEVLKAGVSDEKIGQFFKKVGEMYGNNYLNGFLSKMTLVANWMDKYYGTDIYSKKIIDIKSRMNTKGVTVKAGGGADKYNFGGATPGGAGGDASKGKVKKDVDTITGGGAKNIYITLGKFQDQLNIHTMTFKEGVNEMETMIENSLLRILNSANAISN